MFQCASFIPPLLIDATAPVYANLKARTLSPTPPSKLCSIADSNPYLPQPRTSRQSHRTPPPVYAGFRSLNTSLRSTLVSLSFAPSSAVRMHDLLRDFPRLYRIITCRSSLDLRKTCSLYFGLRNFVGHTRFALVRRGAVGSVAPVAVSELA